MPLKQLLGLPDEIFTPRHVGSHMITKREVRAITLANLGLHSSATVWDIGSGTGAVAIEAARLASMGHVYAIECNADALHAIEANCRRLQAGNIIIVPGCAPEILHALPDPNAIFVGGSGGALPAILDAATTRLLSYGRLVVNLASFEHLTEAANHLRRVGWTLECTMVNIARSQKLLDVTRFAALNPVFVLTAYAQQRQQEEYEISESLAVNWQEVKD